MKFGRSSRLALFIPSLGCGGAEKMMLHLARGFADQGLPLDLIVAQAQGPLAAELPPAVRVIDLGVSRMRYAVAGLVRYLRRERPKAILSQIMHANLAVVMAILLAGVNIRVVLTEVSTLSAGIAESNGYSALPRCALALSSCRPSRGGVDGCGTRPGTLPWPAARERCASFTIRLSTPACLRGPRSRARIPG